MKKWIALSLLGGLLLTASARAAEPAAPASQPGECKIEVKCDPSNPNAQPTITINGVPVQTIPVAAGKTATFHATTTMSVGTQGTVTVNGVTVNGGNALPNPQVIAVTGNAQIDPQVVTVTTGDIINIAAHTEKAAFLGVSASRASAAMRAQLKLKNGLVVNTVEPKSPAEAAGLKPHDILEKLDDQWLINPAQLAGVIRMHKAGDAVTLSVIRENQPQKIVVKLEDREVPVFDEDQPAMPGMPQGIIFNHAALNGCGGPRPGVNGNSVIPLPPGAIATTGPSAIEFQFADAGFAIDPTAPMPVGLLTRFIDGKFDLTITQQNGHRTLTACDRSGKQLFQGPVDTAEQREKVPADIRERLKQMNEIQVQINVQGGKPAKAAP